MNNEDDNRALIDQFLNQTTSDAKRGDDFRAGYVAVVGKPNVGKSTLVNALVGHKVAITSNKVQTTRKRSLGILTTEQAQMIFIDTPGIHQPQRALSKFMMREVNSALEECNALLFVVDVSRAPDDDDQRVAEWIANRSQPKILALNKSDALDPRHVVANVAAYEAIQPDAQSMLTSATRGDNLDKLMTMLLATLPHGQEQFPADQFTDQTERGLVAELIREQALRFLSQEVPHAIAVTVEDFVERRGGTRYAAATIYVERDSQKGILIGAHGSTLKRIGAEARRELERELGVKVFLELWVKVRSEWRSDERAVNELMQVDVE